MLTLNEKDKCGPVHCDTLGSSAKAYKGETLKRFTVLDRLIDNRKGLENRLDVINKAISTLQKNPELHEQYMELENMINGGCY